MKSPLLLPGSHLPHRGQAAFPPKLVDGQLPIFQAPKTSTARAASQNSTGNFGIPAVVGSPTITASTSASLDTFTLTFSRSATDPYFAAVNIYFLPGGSLSTPVLVASGPDSPVKFNVANPATGTHVTVYVQAVNSASQGVAVTNCPSTITTL